MSESFIEVFAGISCRRNRRHDERRGSCRDPVRWCRAVNQAVKAIAISRGFLSPVGIEIVCVPSFADIVIDGEYRTAIRFSVEPRAPYSVHDASQVQPSELD